MGFRLCCPSHNTRVSFWKHLEIQTNFSDQFVDSVKFLCDGDALDRGTPGIEFAHLNKYLEKNEFEGPPLRWFGCLSGGMMGKNGLILLATSLVTVVFFQNCGPASFSPVDSGMDSISAKSSIFENPAVDDGRFPASDEVTEDTISDDDTAPSDDIYYSPIGHDNPPSVGNPLPSSNRAYCAILMTTGKMTTLVKHYETERSGNEQKLCVIHGRTVFESNSGKDTAVYFLSVEKVSDVTNWKHIVATFKPVQVYLAQRYLCMIKLHGGGLNLESAKGAILTLYRDSSGQNNCVNLAKKNFEANAKDKISANAYYFSLTSLDAKISFAVDLSDLYLRTGLKSEALIKKVVKTMSPTKEFKFSGN